MPLEYPADWKFNPPAIEMPVQAHHDFLALVGRIAAGQSAYFVFQTFKEHFGTTGGSTSASWAETDMGRAMSGALNDAVAYVAQFWSAIEELQAAAVPTPRAQKLNDILRTHEVPLVIDLPHLRLATADAVVFTESASTLEMPARADRFTLGAKIGEGGFGTVYKAARATSVASFEYAIKLLNPSPFVADHAKAAARFARESKILQRLQHRAIVPYLETGMLNEQQAYILMPLIEGATLRETSLATNVVLWTFQEVLRGLAYLHAQKVIHRDLKPSNIIIRYSDSQPLILDFGCAFLVDDVADTSLTTAQVGSAAYIPPEVHANPKLRDSRQDVYACGIMLYEVLAGRRPVSDDYVPLATVQERFAPLDALVQDAIAPISRRLSSAQAFGDRLADLMSLARSDGRDTTV